MVESAAAARGCKRTEEPRGNELDKARVWLAGVERSEPPGW